MLEPKSQKDKILNYLESGGVLTPIDALDKFGCFRLAAVICDLKSGGHDIKTTLVNNGKGKEYAKYKLRPKSPLF